ncbi:fungal-specific transcription factor domain-containing protein [Mycena galopus ATCC 62051]|nr:fungal-specific transcription factor domain-containing protein [Mycena galopus ATCC 62051]
MPDGRCSECSSFGSACTYLEIPRKRGRKSDIPMVDELKQENVALKAENASLKAKLRSLSLCALRSQPSQSLPAQGSEDSSPSHSTPENGTTSLDSEAQLGDHITSDELAARFRQITVESMNPMSLGPGSGLALVVNVVAMQEKDSGRELSRPWRPLFWGILPWEKELYDQRPRYNYPPDDLIASLLDLYFNFVHPTIPILHRPSFERSVANGLHLTDSDFGGTLLSVLGIASRYSNDPRVFVDGGVSLSSGWKFINQIRILPKSFAPTIYEVQMYCLMAIYSLGTSVTQVWWLYLSLGIRCLQQRSEHRRKPGGRKGGPEHELWKRAFWTLFILDRSLCFCMGRPATMNPEDHDVEPPLEVDDEYWDRGFIQPLGKPSELSYFIFHSRLYEILGDAMRRLHSSKKWKILLGCDGPDWEQRTVAEFDSSMNDFLDSIPPHLRWDPENPPHGTFFDQSAMLYITYNHLRISIHRPYLQRTTSVSAPSLSICTNAARAVIHTANIWLSKLQRMPLPSLLDAVFASGIILILNMLRARRAGRSMGQIKDKDLVQVAKALDVMKFAESRLQSVGRLWEVLRELWLLESGSLPQTELSLDAVGSPASNGLDGYYSQLSRPVALGSDPLSSDQIPMLRPGMSIEQLLSDSNSMDGMNGILDDELMTMLMATATSNDLNIELWDTYMENRNVGGVDANWVNNGLLEA